MLIIIGLTIIIWILWSRFIRIRLPKDIPFNLTELWFYTLLYICFIYLILIISLLRPRELNPLIAKLIKIMFIPLKIVDAALKHNKYVKKPYRNLIEKIIKRFNKLTHNEMKRLCISYTIVPRLFLSILLCFDTFFMHRLFLIYDFVLIGIFSIIHRYFIYSLKHEKEQYTIDSSKTYDTVFVLAVPPKQSLVFDYEAGFEFDLEKMVYHLKRVTLEEFIDIRIKSLLGPHADLFEYDGDPIAKNDVYKQYRLNKYGNITFPVDLTDEDDAAIYKELNNTWPKLLELSLSLEVYSRISGIPKIRYIKALVYSVYFICWTYILIVSFHKVLEFAITNKIIDWLILYIDKIDPFSGIFL